jgi:hypothetical protein
MKTHLLQIIFALLAGLTGIVVFLFFGMFSGRNEVGLSAICILFLISSALLTGGHSSGWWYIGTAINLPVWSIIFLTDSGKFDLYFWGLIALFLFSNIGSLIGLWFSVNLKRYT